MKTEVTEESRWEQISEVDDGFPSSERQQARHEVLSAAETSTWKRRQRRELDKRLIDQVTDVWQADSIAD